MWFCSMNQLVNNLSITGLENIVRLTKTSLSGCCISELISMNTYDIKRGHYDNIEGGKLERLMKDTFETVKRDGDKLVTSYGALDKLTVWPEGKTKLCIETKMNTKVDGKTATETIRQYNLFLEKATGFSAKDRRKRAKKS